MDDVLNKITIVDVDGFRVVSEADDANPEVMLTYAIVSNMIYKQNEDKINKAYLDCLMYEYGSYTMELAQ